MITRLFTNYLLFEVLVLGIISGMPFAILYTTLISWLKDSGLEITIITTFAIARLPYSLKFLWSPIVDNVKLPFLYKFGRRKSWMIITVVLNIILILTVAHINPQVHYLKLRYMALLLCIISATYDISYDAFRIERLSDTEQGLGAATAVLGYRIGCIICGAGVLYFAGVTSNWHLSIIAIAIIFILGLIFILTVEEEMVVESYVVDKSLELKVYLKLITEPLKEFLTRPNSLIILAAVLLYKAGEAMLSFVSTPFFQDIGFTKQQIAVLVKGIGLGASITGTYIGGLIFYRLGAIKGLFFCGVLQMLSNFMFVWLFHIGPEPVALAVTICVENITSGMGTAALVGYLGFLCNKKYTAFQYSIFTSVSSLINNTITVYSGDIISAKGWEYFFIFTVVLSLPSLLLFLWLGWRNVNIVKQS